jgi:hypothetical protein
VDLPTIHINSANGRWGDDQVEINPLPFDSTNFSFRTELPTIDFDNVIALKERTPRNSDNFFEIRRNGNDTAVKLRNRQELFIGGMKVKFDVSTNNVVSGTVAGRLGLEGPFPLDRVQDYISMVYDSNPSGNHARFEVNRYFLGAATRLRFGGISPPAQGCILRDESPAPIENWSLFLCAP